MSNLKTKRVQIGDHSTATNNFVMHQSDTPDGKVHISNGTLDDHTSKMTLAHDGKLGIGTDSPDVKFHVSGGNARVAGTETSGSFMDINPSNTGSDGVSLVASYYGSGSYGPLKLYTGGSERMRINASGYVTTPNQPSFMAVGSSATPSSGSGWPWGSIIHNTGSHFSLATGRFTAPVAGKYMFFATFIGSNSNDVYRYYTRKNNVNYPKANSQLRLDTAGSSGTDYEYGTSAILMDMAAGDYAAIWFESGGTASHPGGTNTNSGHEIFSGYLIG
jgi:hypothetical protein